MNNKGFTLVELLAVIIILGVIMILAIPSYITTFSKMKVNNLLNKTSELESAALEYSLTVKDDVKKNMYNKKDYPAGCTKVEISDLIKDGYIASESEQKAAINNPVTGKYLSGYVLLCYCLTDFDVHAYYTENFDGKANYFKDQYVYSNGVLYKTLIDYSALGFSATDVVGSKYFQALDNNICD